MGCMGYNDYHAVMKNVPDAKFLPFSGYTPKDKIATTGVRDNETEEEKVGHKLKRMEQILVVKQQKLLLVILLDQT